MSKSRIVTIDDQKLHFYTMGKGPALVMMHPSPSSAESLLPLAKELAENFTVFCVDTPGYGKSDPLVKKPENLRDYTRFLNKAFFKLGLEKPALYGSATGAQLAIRYGLEYPEAVSHIFLDNSAHFDDDLRDKVLKNYFPDLTPKINGNHLDIIWTMVSQMFQFFPWCFTTEEYALNRPQMPLVVLQMVAMDYLKAGEHYNVAYMAAFKHEKGEFVQQLKIPTTIFRWNNSIITPYIDSLLAFELPSNINGFYIEGDAAERSMKMTSFMNSISKQIPIHTIKESAMEVLPDEQVIYVKPTTYPPKIEATGKYLHDAWNQLVLSNTHLNAKAIQESLVDWYSSNSE
ncbi:alpha/beta fold hydrolase [uncultured Croceitalea sp.]|uniref:alpha/beta fold hydrolase n=1 Tax=uncultured Croceitalea sp. TaxID=1798908 RepID=UPI0033059297